MKPSADWAMKEAKEIVRYNMPDKPLENAIAAALRKVRADTVEECAALASMYSIKKKSIHPDLSWDQMNETAQMVAHTTCQHVSDAIRALSNPQTPEGGGVDAEI